jgi:hypothetical protein
MAEGKVQALVNLRKLIQPGDRVYGLKTYTNPLGGASRFSVLVAHSNVITNITGEVARATGAKYRRDGFLVTSDLDNVLYAMSKALNYSNSNPTDTNYGPFYVFRQYSLQ